MTSEIKTIVGMISRPSSTKFVCRQCSNSGNLEVIVYEGKRIEGFVEPGTEIVGYNRFFSACWHLYQSYDRTLPDVDKLDDKTMDILSRIKERHYDPLQYYRVKSVTTCNACKSAQFR